MNFKQEILHRLESLNMSMDYFLNDIFVPQEILFGILDGRYKAEDIEEYHMALICSALKCDNRYFLDEEVRNNDFVNQLNCGLGKKIADIQQFVKDLKFVEGLV